jgi:hypothetical protein
MSAAQWGGRQKCAILMAGRSHDGRGCGVVTDKGLSQTGQTPLSLSAWSSPSLLSNSAVGNRQRISSLGVESQVGHLPCIPCAR